MKYILLSSLAVSCLAIVSYGKGNSGMLLLGINILLQYIDLDVRCPGETRYSECGGRCGDICPVEYRPCPKICAPGCVCPNGLYRTPDDLCVEFHECPSKGIVTCYNIVVF